MNVRHFFGGGSKSDQSAVYLDTAVDQRLAGFEDKDLLELSAGRRDGFVGL